MTTLWGDMETWCERPLKDGTHQYAEGAQIMLWARALDDGTVNVWDVAAHEVSWNEPLIGERVTETCGTMPDELFRALTIKSVTICFHNSGRDRAILRHAGSVEERNAAHGIGRWRCTMAQALAHSLPRGLDRLCEILQSDSTSAS
jgi:DNA polymerase bacteriophage-type